MIASLEGERLEKDENANNNDLNNENDTIINNRINHRKRFAAD